MYSSIEEKIKKTILDLYDDLSDDFDNETIILDTGVIDSIRVIDLILEIESRFSIKIKNHELIYENFKSISAIKKLIESKN